MSPDTESRRELPAAGLPPIGLGLTSASLAVVGMLVFWMPILGAPISAAGLVVGLFGLAAWLFAGADSLRWCVRGIGLGLLALSASVAIYYAPKGVDSTPDPMPRTAPVPTGMDVPPPAPP